MSLEYKEGDKHIIDIDDSIGKDNNNDNTNHENDINDNDNINVDTIDIGGNIDKNNNNVDETLDKDTTVDDNNGVIDKIDENIEKDNTVDDNNDVIDEIAKDNTVDDNNDVIDEIAKDNTVDDNNDVIDENVAKDNTVDDSIDDNIDIDENIDKDNNSIDDTIVVDENVDKDNNIVDDNIDVNDTILDDLQPEQVTPKLEKQKSFVIDKTDRKQYISEKEILKNESIEKPFDKQSNVKLSDSESEIQTSDDSNAELNPLPIVPRPTLDSEINSVVPRSTLDSEINPVGLEPTLDSEIIPTSSSNVKMNDNSIKNVANNETKNESNRDNDETEEKNSKKDKRTRIEKYLEQHRKNRGCCCSISLSMVILFIYFTFYTEKQVKQEMGFVPLTSHVQKVTCSEIFIQNSEIVQIYNNRTLFNYIESTRYHLHKEDISGLTLYHVGLPMCAIVMKPMNGDLKTFFNPRIIDYSKKKYEIQDESDILCASKPIVRKKRFSHIEIEYDDILDECFKGIQGLDCMVTMQRRMEGFDSFLFQHLLDTLKGKNLCYE